MKFHFHVVGVGSVLCSGSGKGPGGWCWRVYGSPMGGTTGVSLEQGLGLTDISRGRPGRRPGGERSSPPDYYFIIDKINPGPHRGRLVGPLVPSS